MSDDLCNDWGCDLVCMGRLSGRKRKTGTMITILADDRRHNNFHRLIEKTTNGLFGLMKLTTNGSDANLYAVTSMTKGNNSGCLIVVVVVTFQETVVRYKAGRQAISRLEADQPASSVRTTRSFLHLHYNTPLHFLIQLRVLWNMTIYVYMKTIA